MYWKPDCPRPAAGRGVCGSRVRESCLPSCQPALVCSWTGQEGFEGREVCDSRGDLAVSQRSGTQIQPKLCLFYAVISFKMAHNFRERSIIFSPHWFVKMFPRHLLDKNKTKEKKTRRIRSLTSYSLFSICYTLLSTYNQPWARQGTR